MKKILFTGGGSAGHVVPNIALIEAVRDEADVCYMGTDGPEKGLIVPLKIPYWEISCPKFIRSFSFRNLKIPAEFLRAEKKATGGTEGLPSRRRIFPRAATLPCPSYLRPKN